MYKSIKYEKFSHYIIYDTGEVYNYKTKKFIIGDINNCGYHRVTLYSNKIKKRVFRHRLVAEHFLKNEENKKFVNHKDGNKANNNVSNLEWCTQSENEKHKFNVLNSNKTTKPVLVITTGKDRIEFESRITASNSIDCPYTTFLRYLKLKRKYKGYEFVQI